MPTKYLEEPILTQKFDVASVIGSTVYVDEMFLQIIDIDLLFSEDKSYVIGYDIRIFRNRKNAKKKTTYVLSIFEKNSVLEFDENKSLLNLIK